MSQPIRSAATPAARRDPSQAAEVVDPLLGAATFFARATTVPIPLGLLNRMHDGTRTRDAEG